MSSNQNGQAGASPNKAQGVINLAPGEGAPKQVTYEDFEKQLNDISNQLKTAGTDTEIAELGKKIADIETEMSKHATKKALTQKLNQLSKKMSDSAEAAAACKGDSTSDGDGKDGDGGDGGDSEDDKPQQAKAHGHGLISTAEDEAAKDPNVWFKELYKANSDSRKQLGNVTLIGKQPQGKGFE